MPSLTLLYIGIQVVQNKGSSTLTSERAMDMFVSTHVESQSRRSCSWSRSFSSRDLKSQLAFRKQPTQKQQGEMPHLEMSFKK